MGPHLLGESPESDRGEEIDGEARVLWIRVRLHRKKSIKRRAILFLKETAPQLGAQKGGHFLKQDLNEYALRRIGVSVIELDALHHRPIDGVRAQQMGKQLGHIPDLVRVQQMDAGILSLEQLIETRLVFRAQFAQSLRHQTILFTVRPLVTARFHRHVSHFLS